MKKYIYKILKKDPIVVDNKITGFGELYETIVFYNHPVAYSNEKLVESWVVDGIIDDYVKEDYPLFDNLGDYAQYMVNKLEFEKLEHVKFVAGYNEQKNFILANLSTWETESSKKAKLAPINAKKQEIAGIYSWIKKTAHYSSEHDMGETKWTDEKWKEFKLEYQQKKFVDLPRLKAELEVLENE